MTQPYYQDERATLYEGDALAVLAQLPASSVDALITDPPYSSGGMFRGDRTSGDAISKYIGVSQHVDPSHLTDFSGDSRDQRAYSYWCALWLSECLRVTNSGGVAMMFTDWRQLPATTDALQSGGWVWRGVIPWYKPAGGRPNPGRFQAHCEYVIWGSKGQMEQDRHAGLLPGFYASNPPREREHITQKPLDVMRGLVQIVPKGGIILDPFMGSGTTGAAAIIEGRNFIGVEQSAAYAQVAKQRVLTSLAKAHMSAEQITLDFDEGVA